MSDIKLSANAQKIMDLVKELTVVDLADLVKALEEEFGVSAAAAAPVMVAGWAEAEDEGDDTVTVELTEVGPSKIPVIKVVKEVLGLGLKDAKAIVEKAPVAIKEKITSEEADVIKDKLEEAGAIVNLK